MYDYNQVALEREKLLSGVGRNHPKLVQLSSQLERAKVNILKNCKRIQGPVKDNLTKVDETKEFGWGSIFKITRKGENITFD